MQSIRRARSAVVTDTLILKSGPVLTATGPRVFQRSLWVL